MISASSKHTLVLDIYGQIWGFGQKHRLGIHTSNDDVNDNIQFEPVHIVSNQQNNRDYCYVSAGEQ